MICCYPDLQGFWTTPASSPPPGHPRILEIKAVAKCFSPYGLQPGAMPSGSRHCQNPFCSGRFSLINLPAAAITQPILTLPSPTLQYHIALPAAHAFLRSPSMSSQGLCSMPQPHPLRERKWEEVSHLPRPPKKPNCNSAEFPPPVGSSKSSYSPCPILNKH